MQNETREILGVEVLITGVASSLSEAVTLAGSEQAVLEYYNGYLLAHSHFTDVRKAMCKKLEEVTGIKRPTKKHGTGEKARDVYVGSEGDYFDLVREQLGEEGFAAHVPALQELVASMQVDYKPGTRGSGGGSAKPAKKWFEYVTSLKTNGKYDEFVAKHSLTGENEEALDVAVAIKVKELVTEHEKAARAAAVASL